jgi:hypothetical protein
MSASVREQPDVYQRFFSVLTQGQSYLNIVYLLLSFPAGLFYFIFLITGLSLGLGLAIVWVGIPILLLVLAGWWGMLIFEREMAIHLLHVEIAPMTRDPNPPQGMWARVKSILSNPVTWKGLAYLLARFPLGILAFVIVVTWFGLTFGLISAPFVYSFASVNLGAGRVATMSDALLCAVVGFVIGIAGLHLMNLMSYVYGQFARLMLGTSQASIVTPSVPTERPPRQAVAPVRPIEVETASETEPWSNTPPSPARRRRTKADKAYK